MVCNIRKLFSTKWNSLKEDDLYINDKIYDKKNIVEEIFYKISKRDLRIYFDKNLQTEMFNLVKLSNELKKNSKENELQFHDNLINSEYLPEFLEIQLGSINTKYDPLNKTKIDEPFKKPIISELYYYLRCFNKSIRTTQSKFGIYLKTIYSSEFSEIISNPIYSIDNNKKANCET